MNLHEIEQERQEAREKVKLEYVKSLNFRDTNEFNELRKTDVKLWLKHWVEIHNRLEAKGLATSITRRCNFRGLLEGETEEKHLSYFWFVPTLTTTYVAPKKRPREWFESD